MNIELRCNSCHAVFPESEAVDDEFCPECGCDSLFEREGCHANEYGEVIPDRVEAEVISPALKAEMDRDLAQALRLASVFDSMFARITR